MLRTILITGAGSGFGEGTALGLARNGHHVIAAAHSWPQVTQLREKVAKMNLDHIRVVKLDLLDAYDVAQTLAWDFDVLVNNAGIGEGGPIAEIPVDLVRRNFEVNVFAPLQLTQKTVRRWIDAGKPGKVVFISSMGGLFSPPGFAAYAATKHAIEAMAEAMQQEMKPFGIQVQTINPGAFLTGFNEAMAESAFRWLDDDRHFTKRQALRETYEALIGNPEGRLDPFVMVARMIEIVPADDGKFRNVVPPFVEALLKAHQASMWDRRIE